jgi:hypothetical protein
MDSGHGARVAGNSETRGASDAAFLHFRWPVNNEDDRRYSRWIYPAELPWPLRFDFVETANEDGSTEWICVGLEIGHKIGKADEGRDTDDFELTAERVELIYDNFIRYRNMAAPVPTAETDERAKRTRSGMARRRRQRLTDDYLVLLVADWRAGRDQLEMARSRGIESRGTIRRQLEEAEQRGFIPEGLPRRNTS